MAPHTIQWDNKKLKSYIELYVDVGPGKSNIFRVYRGTQKQMDTCEHTWAAVARVGHGKWVRGCIHCGHLGR